jgi:hypothetical protein
VGRARALRRRCRSRLTDRLLHGVHDEVGVDLLSLAAIGEQEALLGDPVHEPRHAARGLGERLHGVGEEERRGPPLPLETEGQVRLDLLGVKRAQADADDDALGGPLAARWGSGRRPSPRARRSGLESAATEAGR